MPASIRLRGEWVHALLEALGPGGSDASGDIVSVPPQLLREPLCRVPVCEVVQILRRFELSHGGQASALLLVARGHPHGMFHHLMAAQPDLERALQQLVRFDSLLLTGARIHLERHAEVSSLILWPSTSPEQQAVVEVCLSMLWADLRQSVRSPIGIRVRLRGRGSAPRTVYEKAFGAPVELGQAATALAIRTDDLRTPMRRHNAQVARRLGDMAAFELQVESCPSMCARVELLLRSAFSNRQEHSREAIARRLMITPKTLQRALHIEKASFRSAEDNARRSIAAELLSRSDMSTNEVAQRLGFADKSSLSKACKRWRESSPPASRQRGLPPSSPLFMSTISYNEVEPSQQTIGASARRRRRIEPLG